MFLRRTCKTKGEISFDEPLNVDWDGNELLLSDIMGTDPDLCSRGLEDEVDKALLHMAMEKLTDRERMIVELRYGLNDEGNEKDPKKKLPMYWEFLSRIFPAWKSVS